MMSQTISNAVEENERMGALKKAYAEMLLNTAKEAAARVMAAERKAKKFEHDLLSTKDEAIRMLIRFKQMIQAKDEEAEVASLNQQSRIQELELQLDEAEGLILDLRAKLDEVQEELDDTRSKIVQSSRPNEMVDTPSSLQPFFSELESKSGTSEVLTSSWNPSGNDHPCQSPVKETAISNSEFDNGLVDNPVVAYIVLEKKDSVLFRDGCTQRICAIDKGLVGEKMPLVDDPHPLVKSISIIQKNGGNCITPSGADKLDVIENFVKEAPFPRDNATKDQPVKVQKLHRRKTQYGKSKYTRRRFLYGQCVKKPQQKSSTIARCKSYTLSSKDVDKSGNTKYGKTKYIRGRYLSGQCVEPQQTSSTTALCKSYTPSGKDVDKSGNTVNNEAEHGYELEEEEQLEKHQTIAVVRRSVRKRRVKHWDDFAMSCRPKVKDDDECEEDNDKVASGIVSKCMKDRRASSFDGVGKENIKLIHGGMWVKQNGLTPEIDLENVMSVPSDERDTKMSELTNRDPSQPDSNKPLKYTFSRKRKKGSLINHDENCTFGESATKRRFGQQKDIGLPKNSNAVDEPSSDGRGLVQVACQLISLSGKRWW
ncbi:hypothetical protein ACH5RR_011127 [Cinchona calisaya]|uniref:Uncharacterized protein n=1 Tax=Cinchona calisaya TaxID=153742 RepID=A0ABD3A414_9GENT